MERKHVHAESVIYIGKEANNIDEQALEVKKAQEFINEKAVYNFILNLTPKKAKEKELNFNSRNVGKILTMQIS
ncbi:MAG: DNA-directed DNA polymerase B [Methanolobus sp. T82-4]|jgi:hypothetical protein|nr:MAG: DNA-directed DNA polymerase B [Methanolobus sp. T82-4]